MLSLETKRCAAHLPFVHALRIPGDAASANFRGVLMYEPMITSNIRTSGTNRNCGLVALVPMGVENPVAPVYLSPSDQ